MKNNQENYLEKKPIKKHGLKWSKGEKGEVILEIENKGLANKIAQMLLKKPKVSHIHLDDLGSFAWILADGEKSLLEIGEEVHLRFEEKAEPLYERLAGFFAVLERNGFIEWVSER